METLLVVGGLVLLYGLFVEYVVDGSSTPFTRLAEEWRKLRD